MRNLELKVAVDDLADARQRALALGAELVGTLHQCDTYFRARHGRLKLRETAGAREATLIAYDRPDEAASRVSDYRLVLVRDPEPLKAALTMTLGVLVVVCKEREHWQHGATRIHLDRLAGLGSFVELESRIHRQSAESEAESEHLLVRDGLGLAQRPPIPGSYADLLLALKRAP
jgi:adenylate cyclase class IV